MTITPFGQAGRSRRVDDVGERLGRDREVRVRRRPLGDAVPIDVETDFAFDRAAEVRRALHSVSRISTFASDAMQLQALDRIVRIERHVGAAGFQHADERDDHVERTSERDADAGFGPDPELAEVVRQLVGAGVQLGEREPVIFLSADATGDQRNRIRCARSLRSEQLDDRPARERPRGLVPAREIASARPR
mgnify:CR=1 FL=1